MFFFFKLLKIEAYRTDNRFLFIFVVFHCLLAYVLQTGATNIYFSFLTCNVYFVSGCFLNFLFLFDFQQVDYIMLLSDFYLCLSWLVIINFIYLKFYCMCQFWKKIPPLFLQIFFLSPLGDSVIHIWEKFILSIYHWGSVGLKICLVICTLFSICFSLDKYLKMLG